MVDIGIYTSGVTLEHKLDHMEDGKGPEAAWNMGRLPKDLGKGPGPDRIFFAADGYWRGYFLLSGDVLYNPEDDEKPYSLLFKVSTGEHRCPVFAPLLLPIVAIVGGAHAGPAFLAGFLEDEVEVGFLFDGQLLYARLHRFA